MTEFDAGLIYNIGLTLIAIVFAALVYAIARQNGQNQDAALRELAQRFDKALDNQRFKDEVEERLLTAIRDSVPVEVAVTIIRSGLASLNNADTPIDPLVEVAEDFLTDVTDGQPNSGPPAA